MNPLFLNRFAPNLIQTQRIRSPVNFYPQNSYLTKSKMAAAAILKITFSAITRSLLHIFAPNLIDRLKTTPRLTFAIKICICKNPRRQKLPFWNQLIGDNSAICGQIRTKFDTETETEVLGFTSKIDIPKNHRWWQCHTEIQIISHNSILHRTQLKCHSQ